MISINIERKLHGASGSFTLAVRTEIKQGELISIYGPSGSGKSSMLRMIAGLMHPDKGSIVVDGITWNNSTTKTFCKPQQRNIGMVFQDYSLFPNMTVLENIRFALSKGDDRTIADELIEVADLKNLQHQKPMLLSGGQRQRVALARALVRRPKILLLDEPLSTLDLAMRTRLQDFIFTFHERFGLTTLLVSHDLPEIIRLSQRVLVLESGRISQDCKPQSLLP